MALSKYDIVGFVDDYPRFIQRLRGQAGLRYEYGNQRHNVTQGRISVNDVPKATIEAIEQVNHLDVELYKRIKKAYSREMVFH